MSMRALKSQVGFALVLTIALLALMVLAIFALSVLVRVDGRISNSAAYQVQARENALLGLSEAIGNLQQAAGHDSRLTGMAGIVGVSASSTSTTRYWCGVWESDGTFVTWLTSGAATSTAVSGESIELISAGSVGAASSTSANVEKEHVVAGRIPVSVVNPASHATESAGSYAYVVVDEGVKLSAYAPPSERPDASLVVTISSGMLQNQIKLKTAIESGGAKLNSVLSYEQLALVALPSAPLTPSVLQDTFHYVTLTSRSVAGNQVHAGTININTTSTLVWRCLLDFYNSTPGAVQITNVSSKGNAIGNGFAGATRGKLAHAPFTSIAGLADYLESPGLFPTTGSPTGSEIIAALNPILVVRSDSFRIRAYGEAVNLVDGTRESAAFCEAIVQRTADVIDATLGRRFVITYFRWLGPDDI